jgi:hypothetical protein
MMGSSVTGVHIFSSANKLPAGNTAGRIKLIISKNLFCLQKPWDKILTHIF